MDHVRVLCTSARDHGITFLSTPLLSRYRCFVSRYQRTQRPNSCDLDASSWHLPRIGTTAPYITGMDRLMIICEPYR